MAEMESAISFITSESPEAKNKPVIVWIPGGPGLSSNTLRSMEFLKRSFDLVFVDPPGTGKSKGSPIPTFADVIQSIGVSLSMLKRPLVLAGHSFGGCYIGD